MTLSKKQQEIIDTTASKVVVIAAASAGKTTILVERLRKLIDDGVNPSEIVAITFTVSAAANIKERLGDKAKGIFISTVHAYANYLLLSRGIDTHDLLDDEQFDKLFDLVKKHPNCLRHVSHLLLDESQDSTAQQFEFFEMINPDNYFYVGDYRQSIFQYAGACPQYILNLTHENDVTTYHLTDNYRCGSRILDFAKSIIRLNGYDYIDNSYPAREVSGRVCDVDFSQDRLIEAIAKYGDYGNWFVLCRTNGEVLTFCDGLKRKHIPYDTFKRKEMSNEELTTRMKQDTVKVLTIHSAKGLEAKNVIVIGAKFYNVEERCVSYVAATRARDLLVWTRTSPKNKYKTVNWES